MLNVVAKSRQCYIILEVRPSFKHGKILFKNFLIINNNMWEG